MTSRDQTSFAPVLPGDRVRFAQPGSESRWWWNVRAIDKRYAILTRQAPFRPRGESLYTIVDVERGVRGPCDLLVGWDIDGDGLKRASGIPALMDALHGVGFVTTRVSRRHGIPLSSFDVRSGRRAL